MFGNRTKGNSLQKRYFYGKTPILQNKDGFLKKKKNGIRNIMPEPQKIKKTFILISIAAGILIIFYWIFLSSFFTIKEVTIDYKEAQEENAFLKDYFKDYIGKNIIFANIENGANKAKVEHPEFKSLIAQKSYPNKIKISFSAYTSIANIINTSGGGIFKFIVNEIGMATQKDMENPNLPFIKISTEKPLNFNTILLTQEKIKYILGCAKFFEEKFNMKVLEIEYLMQEKELHLKTEKYFTILLDIQKPYEEQLLKLKKALSKLDIYTLPLEYIDLRIYSATGEKIIYKKRR
ncbi:MAG: hypothetical protein WCT36_02075 [Candidatus Gracilibacteria bacterium]|jgi:hypothetical protein